ncbi:MAG: ComEA family DNA-binding protein [Desulfobulbaceae bacterium]|nr:ComEA family DNA-binding protein [Desulfobulbaceae bacterium]
MNKFYLSFLLLLLMVSTAFAQVNVNTANVDELSTLKGIGPAKAQAIVDYREKNGPFKFGEDLTKVKGVGPKIMEKIKDEISVSASETENNKNK